MHPELAGLVRLQATETELRRQESLLAAIPMRRQEVEDRLKAEHGGLEAIRSALDVAQKSRKQLEASVQDLETRRSKYKGQLMEVKTNKEYTAMLHEIEGVEREIRTREDQILFEMEKLEGLAAEARKAEGIFKEAEALCAAERRDLDAREQTLRLETERARREREEARRDVPAAMMALYERVAHFRGGVGVSTARDGACSACHVRLRLQLWADIKKNEAVIQCPACQRVLYYEPPVPTVDVEA